jgi:hypothetical protein
MSDANYRIKYKKGDFEIEIQGNKEWVEEKLKQFIRVPSPSLPAVNPPDPYTPIIEVARTPAPSESIVEFLKAKGDPDGHTERALLFTYWLFRKGMPSYNTYDIESCFDEARLSKPTNTSDVMNRLQSQGFVMTTNEKDGKKAWVITQTGEKQVEQLKVVSN